MKRLPVIILMLVVGLVAVVTGCGGVVRYDSRLTAADSLMRSDPDSALAIVEGLTLSELATAGDSAYHDLLLTQAHYRCYVTATSDSAINRALVYYRLHTSEQEKLTRAYIYKGAVMEELGHPDSAMLYYKHAEATAAPDDYFNLGYIKMRIATLYQDEFSQDSAAIIRLKDAIHCFEVVKDTNYLISCYGHLGAICGIVYPDSTKDYLNQAINLAIQSNSPKQYTYKSKLAGFYFYHDEDYRTAKELAMDVFRNGQQDSKEKQFYYYAIWSYLRLGQLDSAKLIFEATPAPCDQVDSMNLYQTVAEFAKAENDLTNYSVNIVRSHDTEISYITGKHEDKLKAAESEYDKIEAESHALSERQGKRFLSLTSSILFIVTLLLLYLILRLRHTIKKRNKERTDLEHTLDDTISRLEQQQRELDQTQDYVSKLFAYRVDALNELFSSIKFQYKRERQGHTRGIVTLSSVVSGLNELYKPLSVELSADFWNKMKMSVDGELNGIVSYVEENYPQLTKKELRLFTMLCAKISPQIIKICLNYTHVNSVTNNRRIIIKQKMGLDMSLEDFVEKYMKNEL